jgi:hypothetical protein
MADVMHLSTVVGVCGRGMGRWMGTLEGWAPRRLVRRWHKVLGKQKSGLSSRYNDKV